MTSRTIVITGAGTGVGAACARHQAALGHHVVLIGRREQPLLEVQAETGGLVLAGDAASADCWQTFIARIHEVYGGVDSLICSAGGHGLGSATAISEAEWHDSMRLNLDTVFISARACLPSLIERQGSIVTLGSLASVFAGAEVSGYTTAKHAVVGLTRSLARDFGPKGVRVNCVCPGWIISPMADEEMEPLMKHYGESRADAYARVTRHVPLKRPATAEEVANVCNFLISPAASIVTGSLLFADGGSQIIDAPMLAFEEM